MGQTQSSADLVESFAHTEARFDVYASLVAQGLDALPAIRRGLKHPDWQVRRWCAICLDRVADSDALGDLVPLLIERAEDDESLRVRRMAVIMLGTEHMDPRAVPVLQQILEIEEDRKLLLHAREGLERIRQAGLEA